MQKVLYLLHAAGAPIDASFYLHLYGPYSSDVAQLTDQLVREGLLTETPVANAAGRQFEYSLPAGPRASLRGFEQSPTGKQRRAAFQPFKKQARDLLNRELSELEYASTIAYFMRQTRDWETALEKACQFKRLDAQCNAARSALALAKQVMEPTS
ncbi:MAG: hypothetical protein DCC68_15090 [Planctomycetota bacterium]|nr:MAG: hypothetical protein DCC68_15090 [Planctomycetota bacterium]